MKHIFDIIVFTLMLSVAIGCNGSNKQTNVNAHVGGACDGCELIYLGMPKVIQESDTSSGWFEAGDQMVLSGVVYKPDGTTPAPDIIIYYWQTDNAGLYTVQKSTLEIAREHGHIRGWVKTNNNGEYAIYTIRPGSYPNTDMPAHIHFIVKEPGINEYYIDDAVFDDDTLLSVSKRKAFENRGGSGVLNIKRSGALLKAERNIILGLNIPNYQKQ